MPITLTASKHEFDEFFKSNVWRDIKAKFEADLRKLQETDLTTLEGIPLYRTQGTAKAIQKGLAIENYIRTAFEVRDSVEKRKAETQPKETKNAP